jgi:hypothetical protein
MKKILSVALILILSSAFFNSCKKNKDIGEAPVLPPAESMTIDFSNFLSQKKSLEVVPGQKGTENSNWEFAATVAGIWRLIISTTLAIPVISFELAVNQEPVYLSDHTWQWSYNATIADVVYKARLTGQIQSSNVAWKMYITKEGSYNDFLWFEGTSNLDGSGGQWTLYQSNLNPVALLRIDWTKSGTTVGTIKYTYIKASDPFQNSYIEYGLTTSTLNAYYSIHYYNGAKFSDVDVEWNTITHEGRIKSLDYLGDTNWYCWDSNLVNVSCP